MAMYELWFNATADSPKEVVHGGHGGGAREDRPKPAAIEEGREVQEDEAGHGLWPRTRAGRCARRLKAQRHSRILCAC